jgi:hypothetical protein
VGGKKVEVLWTVWRVGQVVEDGRERFAHGRLGRLQKPQEGMGQGPEFWC